MTRRMTGACGIVVVVLAARLGAVSILAGIEPGRSTRAEFEKVFGPATRELSATRAAYAPKDGAAAIEVEYKHAVVDRIDLVFEPLGVASVLQALGLTTPSASGAVDGRAVDYFGGSNTYALTHQSDTASDIVMVSYLSPAAFDAAVRGLGTVKDPGPPSKAVQLSNPDDGPVILKLNPAACSQLYLWAQQENDVAKKTKQASRRIAILDIVVASQKGDCLAATRLADRYRRQYK